MKTYRATVGATVELAVTVKEYENGEIEIIEVEDVIDILDFDNVRKV